MTEVSPSRVPSSELREMDTPAARDELARRKVKQAPLRYRRVGRPDGVSTGGQKDDADNRVDGVSTGGQKNDAGKPPLALLPWEALIDVAKVLDAGAAKYGRENWRKGIGYHRLLDAQMRHLAAFTMGEDFDPETGLSHLAHAACCNLFLLTFVVSGRIDLDDRYHASVEE